MTEVSTDSEARDLPLLRAAVDKARREGVFGVKPRAVEVGRAAIYAADVADPRSTAEIVVDALIAEGLLPGPEAASG